MRSHHHHRYRARLQGGPRQFQERVPPDRCVRVTEATHRAWEMRLEGNGNVVVGSAVCPPCVASTAANRKVRNPSSECQLKL